MYIYRAGEEYGHYQQLFEATPEPYLLTDARGVVKEMSHAATILLHADRQSVIGSSLATFVAGGDLRRASCEG